MENMLHGEYTDQNDEKTAYLLDESDWNPLITPLAPLTSPRRISKFFVNIT